MSGYSNNLLSNRQVLDPKHELLQKNRSAEVLGSALREAFANKRAASADEQK